MQSVINHINKNQLSNIYLICGEEEFNKKICKQKLTECILNEPADGNMNYHFYDGASFDIQDFTEQASTLPFFSERQLLVVSGSNLFKTSSVLADKLPDLPDSTYIIFYESAYDKRNSLYKYVKSKGTIFELNHESDNALPMWIARHLNQFEYRITMRAAKLIISKAGVDKSALSCELEKLIAYTAETKTIDIEDVEAVCTTLLTNKIFAMMDFIVSGKKTEALNLYKDLVIAKESPAKILSLLSRHYNILMQIKDMPRESDMNIAKKLSVPSFAVKKYKSQASLYNKQDILRCLTACATAETDFKTGRIQPQLAIEILIIQLSSINN